MLESTMQDTPLTISAMLEHGRRVYSNSRILTYEGETTREAAVVAVPDERWGERPLACVVLRDGAQATCGELGAYLGGKVASWWLPERWAFLAEVPKTSVGKFDKKVLRAQYAEGELEVTQLPAGSR